MSPFAVRRPRQTGKPSPAAVSPRNGLLTRADAYALGKKLREKCPRAAHAVWRVPRGRPDAVELVLSAEKGRVRDLLPLRHGRMARSAFTFYRGAALTMASDLASTPASGLRVQCCGDAHLSNFGGFATPERRVIFSINDLDETLPAPWEWDVKRLATSFVVACRDNSLSDDCARNSAATCVRTYRQSMAEFSEMKTLELWYQALDGDQLPTIFHHAEVPAGVISQAATDALAGYRATLSSATQSLLDRYELRDAAIKVVGIGSVGTACWVLLYMAGEGDPLFLQVKEARASVLERYAGASVFSNHGQRVVDGYRLLQPASDMFLGWTQGPKR